MVLSREYESSKDMAELAVRYATKSGAAYADARVDNYWGEDFTLENGNLILSAFDTVVGIGMRLLVNNSLGFVTLNTADRGTLRKLVNSAIRSVKRSSRLVREPVDLSKEKSYSKKYALPQRIKLQDISPADSTALLKDIDLALMSSGLPVSGRVLDMNHSVIQRYFTDSDGTRIESAKPLVDFSYLLTIGKGQTSQRYSQLTAAAGAEVYQKMDIRGRVLREAKMLFDVLNRGVKPPTGVVDVVLGPEVVGIAVHESGGHPYEADRIFGREAAQAGESFIVPGMVGRSIGSEAVTIVDDPTIPGSAGFFLFDDEGVPARRKILMKGGAINEFLHNRETARAMNLQSNGSARVEDYSCEPIVRMSNTFMLPGTHTEAELIEGVKHGVYIKSYMEWNIDDLRLNQKYVGCEAYLIENGRLGKLVKNPALEISTLDFYKSIDALGKKVEFGSGSCGKGEPLQAVPVWMGGPAARLRRIKLG